MLRSRVYGLFKKKRLIILKIAQKCIRNRREKTEREKKTSNNAFKIEGEKQRGKKYSVMEGSEVEAPDMLFSP